MVQVLADLLLLGNDRGPIGSLPVFDLSVFLLAPIFEHLHEVVLLALRAGVLAVIEGANLNKPFAVIEVQLTTRLNAVYHLFYYGTHGRVLAR